MCDVIATMRGMSCDLCLDHLKTLNIQSVGIPSHIGCGLSGGDWNMYFNIIEDFAKNTGIDITIVRPSI